MCTNCLLRTSESISFIFLVYYYEPFKVQSYRHTYRHNGGSVWVLRAPVLRSGGHVHRDQQQCSVLRRAHTGVCQAEQYVLLLQGEHHRSADQSEPVLHRVVPRRRPKPKWVKGVHGSDSAE